MTPSHEPPTQQHPPSSKHRRGFKVKDVLVWIAALIVLSYTTLEVTALALRVKHSSSSRATLVSRTATPVTGQELSSELDVDFSRSKNTLLFVLSSRCVYCLESMPFYRQLLSRRPTSSTVRFVGVCIEPQLVCENYLQKHGVTMDEIVSVSQSRYHLFNRTPMVILADRAGRVTSTWTGRQRTAEERAIETTILQAASDH